MRQETITPSNFQAVIPALPSAQSETPEADKQIIVDEPKSAYKAVKYKTSPFIEQTSLRLQTRKKRLTVSNGRNIVDGTTGEVEGVTEISQVVQVDTAEFIKLYTQDIKAFFELSNSAMKTFFLVMKVVGKGCINNDKVYIDYKDELLDELGVSRPVFYRGMEELIKKSIIAKNINPGWYFINPTMFFNGDRVRFIKEYRNVDDTDNHYYRIENAKYCEEQKALGRGLGVFTKEDYDAIEKRAKNARWEANRVKAKPPRLDVEPTSSLI